VSLKEQRYFCFEFLTYLLWFAFLIWRLSRLLATAKKVKNSEEQ
jgi:hypothetical protein